MVDSESGRRRYDSLHRMAQAKQTHAEIAAAARRLFLARGWAATTVREVAREAGVSAPTVYAAYANKSGLVRALVDSADLSADPVRMVAELESTPDPRRQLAAMVGYDRRLFERAGDLIALLREAGRVEPDLAAAYEEGRRLADRTRREVFSAWPANTLRPDLDLATAVDIYAALCNIDVYTTLIAERGWPPQRIEEWWAAALDRELLDQKRKANARKR
ncbi:TetR/AcrR family transcriptional regulator [Nocardia sp. NPDC050406]|uniref:TetR/AcrR family transcriptional regulator n=1 Tax=Nocardia sp. NPDC050406 TaxID=3364318 RepID=UPI0037A31429